MKIGGLQQPSCVIKLADALKQGSHSLQILNADLGDLLHMQMSLVDGTGRHSEGETMAIVSVGIDAAKSVFAVHGVDEAGKVQLRQPRVARGKLNALIASLLPCAIGMEACAGAPGCCSYARSTPRKPRAA